METDIHGLVVDKFGVTKVFEVGEKMTTVVGTFGISGEPVVCVCVNDRQLVGIVRPGSVVEISRAKHSTSFQMEVEKDDYITVIYVYNKSSESCRFLTCTAQGKLTLGSVDLHTTSATPTLVSWDIENIRGKIIAGNVNEDESAIVLIGNDDLIMCDLNNRMNHIFLPPKSSPPSSISCATFFDMDKMVAAGFNCNNVCIYQVNQQNPIHVIEFTNLNSIKTIARDPKASVLLHVGDGSGNVASIPYRQVLKNNIKSSDVVRPRYEAINCHLPGSVKSIAGHPKRNVIASCGWDSYLRIWHTSSNKLLYDADFGTHSSIVVFRSGNSVLNEAPKSKKKSKNKNKKKKEEEKEKEKEKSVTDVDISEADVLESSAEKKRKRNE